MPLSWYNFAFGSCSLAVSPFQIVVPWSTAVLAATEGAASLAFHRRHEDLIRFMTDVDGDYQAVKLWLQEMATSAPEWVRDNWLQAGSGGVYHDPERECSLGPPV